MRPVPHVTVGFIHVDEPTVRAARESILAQEDVRIRIEEVRNLPQFEAHRRLYEALDRNSADSDFLVKVDGDMIINHPRLFAAVSVLFDEESDIDRISVGVDDWFSGRVIDGMAFWRGGVRWSGKPDPVRMDHIETTARASLRIIDHGLPLVTHGVEPTPEQAVRYGIHRGRKARLSMTRIRIADAAAFVESVEADPNPLRLLAAAALATGLDEPERTAPLMADRIPEHELLALEERTSDPELLKRAAERLAALESQRLAMESVSEPPTRTERFRDGLRGTLRPLVRMVRQARDRGGPPEVPETPRSPGAERLRAALNAASG